jgi:hypothetical protein
VGPVVFEVHPPARNTRQSALDTLLESRRFVEGLIDRYT